MKNKAVILGTNYYIGLSIIRCLGREGVYTISMDYSKKNTYGSKSKYLKEQIICPHYEKESEKLKDFLIDYAKKQDGKPVLFPSADQYAEFIDKYLLELKEYFYIWMSEEGLWTKIMDKDELFKLAVKYNMPVPETISPKEKNFLSLVEKDIGFPCLIKPTDSPKFVSEFREKLFKCNNFKELEDKLNLIEEKNLDVIVQRMIPGFDNNMYTFDFYANENSDVTHWTTCRKHRQYPINYGASVYTEQKYIKELYDIGVPFLKKIGYKGFGEIEFKKDSSNGNYYLIEINARTTNLNSLLNKVGLNFPYIAYRDILGNPIEEKAVDYNTNIYFRYLQEDVLAIKSYIKTKQLRKREIIKSLFHKKAPAIWSLDDPMPGIFYFKEVINKIV